MLYAGSIQISVFFFVRAGNKTAVPISAPFWFHRSRLIPKANSEVSYVLWPQVTPAMSTKLLKKFFSQQASLDLLAKNEPSGPITTKKRPSRVTRVAVSKTREQIREECMQKKVKELMRFDRLAADKNYAGPRLIEGMTKQQQEQRKAKKRLLSEEDGSGVGNSRSSSSKRAKTTRHEPTVSKERVRREREAQKFRELVKLVRKDSKEKAKRKK